MAKRIRTCHASNAGLTKAGSYRWLVGPVLEHVVSYHDDASSPQLGLYYLIEEGWRNNAQL